MRFVRNLLALIGLAAIIAVAVVLYRYESVADAMTWRVAVKEGMTVDEIEQTMKFVANQKNLSYVGELKISKGIEAKLGKPYRLINIYTFCDSVVAAKLLDYRDVFTSFMPCRIALVRDVSGKYWLMGTNLDWMIHGGWPLPEDLKAEAVRMRDALLDVMNRGATGDF